MNDLDWDSLCVDPHHDSLENGREEGRQAGRQAGFNEGRKLGQTTAIEFGMEIGFIRGIVDELHEKESLNERVRKTLHELHEMILKFPEAQELFQQAKTPHESSLTGAEEKNDFEDDSEKPANEADTVRHLLQRIRGRFRLLMVQLKLPYLSLKQVMNETEQSSFNSNPPSSEW